MRVDVAVVGGGVIGLAVAWELARHGRRPLVLERGGGGGAASAAAAGMLAPISEAEVEEPSLTALGQDSLARYPTFVRELEADGGSGCGYLDDGTLWVALDRDDREELERLEHALCGKGLVARPLAPAEARRLEPHLSGRVVSALLVEGDHQVDPRALVRCLARALCARGGQIAEGHAVDSVERAPGGGFALSGREAGGRRFAIEAERVVVAAGAWTARLRLPVEAPGLRPVKGQLVRLAGPRLLRRVLRLPDAYLVPRRDGALLVGATVEEMGFDLQPGAGAVMDLLRRAWEALPGIYDLVLSEVAVGLRSAVDDHLPVIGESEVAGLFFAVGHFRNGVLLAPVTAHYLARWIDEGRAPAELAAFGPDRLRARAPGAGGATAGSPGRRHARA